MCTTAFSAMDDSIVDEAMLKTQQTEMAHLHKGQAESHEKLLHSFCIGEAAPLQMGRVGPSS